MQRSPIKVCIIGSSKFRDAMRGLAQRETLKGKIVLMPGFYHHVDRIPISDAQKSALDALMLCKIDFADEVLVCNVNGYVGKSTHAGMEHARAKRMWKEYDLPDIVPSAEPSGP